MICDKCIHKEVCKLYDPKSKLVGCIFFQSVYKKGEWIGDTDYESCQGMYERYKCSECGYGIDWRAHNQLMCQDEIPEEYREYYCPHCGSKLIEEVKKNEKTD